jgi:hypothetical protein
MARVNDIATVAHNWANGIGEEARASNLFFEQGNIYSYGYHFLIAKHVYNANGGHAVLLTQKKYSKSTSAQVTLVMQASRHIQQLSVHDPNWPAEELFDKWYNSIKAIAGGLNNARKPERDILEIRRIYAEAKRYAEFFGYEIPEVLQKAGVIENVGQYHEVIGQEIKLRKAQAKREKAEALRIQKVNLKRWRAFQTNYLTTTDGYDYLRYDNAKERLETTQRVEILIAVANQFYAVVLATIAKGGCTDCKLRLMDSYDVLNINKNFIKVGCHKISLKEIKSFAKKQGW